MAKVERTGVRTILAHESGNKILSGGRGNMLTKGDGVRPSHQKVAPQEKRVEMEIGQERFRFGSSVCSDTRPVLCSGRRIK